MADTPPASDPYELEETSASAAATSAAAPAPVTGATPTGEGVAPSADPAQLPASARDPASGRFARGISPRLARMARDLGMSAEEIAAYDPQDLREIVNDATLERLSQRQTGEAKPQTAAGASTAGWTDPQTGDSYDPENYDPGIASLMRAMQAMRRELEHVKTGLGQVAGFQQARIQETLTSRADRWFAKNPARYGKGQWNEIAQDGSDMVRRNAIANLARTFKDGDLEAKLQKAEEILYGAAEAKPQAEPPPAAPAAPAAPTNGHAPSPAQWAEGGLARPTHRAGAGEPLGTARATQAVAEALAGRAERDETPASADDFLP